MIIEVLKQHWNRLQRFTD